MSEIKVNSIKGVSATTPAVTINNTDGTCTANITNRTNKNLIINGAMLVAARGTSSTDSGYGSVDRFRVQHSGTDEAPTQSQVDVASGTTPYTLGFRKAFRITNGNQTSGAGATDSIHYEYYAEAQDIANSGWNYTDSNSFITLSFWIKSSVAQNFQGRVRTRQGTSYNYAFETGSLSADTWTKVTKTISGNSNLQFDNDTAKNFQIDIYAFYGTDRTDNSVTLNTWAAYSSGTQTKDNTSTWYTTNDATLELTGVQLEVSDHATSFQHRSFQEEQQLCYRYFQHHLKTTDEGYTMCWRTGSDVQGGFQFFREMRSTPTATIKGLNAHIMSSGGNVSMNSMTLGLGYSQPKLTAATVQFAAASNSGTAGDACPLHGLNGATIKGFYLDAEL